MDGLILNIGYAPTKSPYDQNRVYRSMETTYVIKGTRIITYVCTPDDDIAGVVGLHPETNPHAWTPLVATAEQAGIHPVLFDAPTATAAIQLAIDHAESIALQTNTRQAVTLGAQCWELDSTLYLNGSLVGIKDGLLEPSADFKAENDGNWSLIRIKGGLRHIIDNVILDCNGVADGILCDADSGYYNLYTNLEIKSFKNFGIRLYGTADQRVDKCLIWQNQEDTLKRVGIGIDVLTGDVKIHNSVVRYCGINLRINAHTTHCTDNHFYNGNSGALNPARNSINVQIDGGFGQTFADTYLDKGSVVLKNGASQWTGTRFLFKAEPDHDAIFFLESDGIINKSLAENLPVLSGGTYPTAPLNYGAIALIKLISNNGGSWSADSEKLADQINDLRLVDIQPQLDGAVTESVFTQLSMAADFTKNTRFADLTIAQNDGQKISECYAPGTKKTLSSGFKRIDVATGEFTTASYALEGSRNSTASVASIAFKNRYGSTSYDDVSSTAAFLDYIAASAGYAGELQVKLKPTGATTPTTAISIKLTTLYPGADNTVALGSASNRFTQLFANNTTINTSDEREKTNIAPIDDAVLKAWEGVEYCQYQWIDAVAQKGDKARNHFGVVAQKIKDVFEKAGLDPFKYGVLCYDEWGDQYLEDENGNLVQTRKAGNRYGVRYEQAIILECALMRRRLMMLSNNEQGGTP